MSREHYRKRLGKSKKTGTSFNRLQSPNGRPPKGVLTVAKSIRPRTCGCCRNIIKPSELAFTYQTEKIFSSLCMYCIFSWLSKMMIHNLVSGFLDEAKLSDTELLLKKEQMSLFKDENRKLCFL